MSMIEVLCKECGDPVEVDFEQLGYNLTIKVGACGCILAEECDGDCDAAESLSDDCKDLSTRHDDLKEKYDNLVSGIAKLVK